MTFRDQLIGKLDKHLVEVFTIDSDVSLICHITAVHEDFIEVVGTRLKYYVPISSIAAVGVNLAIEQHAEAPEEVPNA